MSQPKQPAAPIQRHLVPAQESAAPTGLRSLSPLAASWSQSPRMAQQRQAIQAALGPAAVHAPAPRTSATANAQGTIQRYVGLELEHSVPIYKDLGPQEASLRAGSFEYDNAHTVYTAGNVVTKVDNSPYGKALGDYLIRHNPGKHENKIPSKGISIPEYTTLAPGLDELADGARTTFQQHVSAVKQEAEQNLAGQSINGCYVGVPTSLPEAKGLDGYDRRSLQVTAGVFASQLDAMHQSAVMHGRAGGHLREPHNIINSKLMHSQVVQEAVAASVAQLGVNSDLWGPLRLKWMNSSTDVEGWAKFEERLKADVVTPLIPLVGDTVRSLFRVALSYCIGARLKIPTDEIEKNAVPLLARRDLGKVFFDDGAHHLLRTHVKSMILEVISTYAERIDELVGALHQEDPTILRPSNHEVLGNMSLSELMIKMIKGEVVKQIQPGSSLDNNDPTNIQGKGYNEPHRFESGGVQFEYRTVSRGSWESTFMAIGQETAEHNTKHLPQTDRDEVLTKAGWK